MMATWRIRLYSRGVLLEEARLISSLFPAAIFYQAAREILTASGEPGVRVEVVRVDPVTDEPPAAGNPAIARALDELLGDLA